VGRTINAVLKLRTPFDWAIFTQNGIELKNSATVDWYNFTANDGPMQVGTNSIAAGAVDLKNNGVINGDVAVGPGGDPSVVINGASGITGRTYAMTEAYELPPIVVPAWLQNMPSGGTINNSKTVSTSGKYDGINLNPGKNKVLTIDKPVALYITGNIILGNSATVQIDPNGSLTLYAGGNIDFKNGSNLNVVTQNAKRFILYALNSCTSIRFFHGSSFYGAIYAPNAFVEFKNSGNVYGAVVAQSIDMKNSSLFEYDAALRNVTVDDEAVRFVIKRWNEE
jgi:choice-of-anchor A domain-containing protein